MKTPDTGLHETPPSKADAPSFRLWLAIWGVWMVGVALTVVLIWQGQTIADGPTVSETIDWRGCGKGQSCDHIFASSYGQVLGIPLTQWALGYYALVAGTLIVAVTGSRLTHHPPPRSLMLPVVTFLGVAGGLWCMVVMVHVLGSLCAVCAALHGANLVLFLLSLAYTRQDWRYVQGQRWHAALRPLPATPVLLHILLAVLLASTQVVALNLFREPPEPFSTIAVPSARLSLHEIRDRAMFGLSGHDADAPTLWTTIGPRDAPHRVVVFLCPTCPACVRLVRILDVITEAHTEPLRVDIRFVPLWHTCNDAVPQETKDLRHREACALVRSALAVGEVRPDAFGDYLDWMFAAGSDLNEAKAVAQARTRVDAETFDVAGDSDLLWKRFRDDMRLAGQLDVRSVPQIFLPRGQVLGGITVENLDQLLSEEFGWSTAEYPESENPPVWVGSDHIEQTVHRARRLSSQGQFARAAEAYQTALALKPDWLDASLELAWLLATCKTDDVRDGAESIRLVTIAQQALDKMASREEIRNAVSQTQARLFDTLAAAHAESGDFEKAQKFAKQAMVLHDRNQQPSEAILAKSRLDFYKRHEPYRE